MKRELSATIFIFLIFASFMLLSSCKKKSVDIGLRYSAQFYDSAIYQSTFLGTDPGVKIDSHYHYDKTDDIIFSKSNDTNFIKIRSNTYYEYKINKDTTYFMVQNMPPVDFSLNEIGYNWNSTYSSNNIILSKDTLTVISQYFSHQVQYTQTLKAAINKIVL